MSDLEAFMPVIISTFLKCHQGWVLRSHTGASPPERVQSLNQQPPMDVQKHLPCLTRSGNGVYPTRMMFHAHYVVIWDLLSHTEGGDHGYGRLMVPKSCKHWLLKGLRMFSSVPLFISSTEVYRKEHARNAEEENKHLLPKYWALEMNPRPGTCLRCSMLSPPLTIAKS